MERLPVEEAISAQTRAFKAIGRANKTPGKKTRA
jgi:hypothetical protein